MIPINMMHGLYYIDLRVPRTHIDAPIYTIKDGGGETSTHEDDEGPYEGYEEYAASEARGRNIQTYTARWVDKKLMMQHRAAVPTENTSHKARMSRTWRRKHVSSISGTGTADGAPRSLLETAGMRPAHTASTRSR